ncbi:MAG: RluA family pseudouridine synthase [Aestuariivita sp.]|nr:RluA family pseudouridine synthase [Aestuariivita sp.]
MQRTALKFVISSESPVRLDKALCEDAPEDASLSRNFVSKLVKASAVLVNGVIETSPSMRVKAGDCVVVSLPNVVKKSVEPEKIPLDVVYEDDDLIVINKPAGMVVHPAFGHWSGTLANALLAHCNGTFSLLAGEDRPGIVHRIDKDTSGLLVSSKTDEAHLGLLKQFKDHSVERKYEAIVYGVPDANDLRMAGIRGVSSESENVLKITTQLSRSHVNRRKQAVVFAAGRHAVTRVTVCEEFDDLPVASRIHCRLETGRTHQIRLHLAYVGHGLIGDSMYGGRRRSLLSTLSDDVAHVINTFPRQALHARVLGFRHPVSDVPMRFEAERPPDMIRLLEVLRTVSSGNACTSREKVDPSL